VPRAVPDDWCWVLSAEKGGADFGHAALISWMTRRGFGDGYASLLAFGCSMGRVVIETAIQAPQELCFDLARDVSVYARHASKPERVVAPGRLTGLLEQNERVTYEARHLGVTRRLTVQMVEFAPPERFLDEQIHGPFVWMQHLHEFEEDGPQTLMRDTMHWKMPYGILGRLLDGLVVTRYVRQWVADHAGQLKRRAEMGV
jgi:ligand-binding SRPBCC domain-containing protein